MILNYAKYYQFCDNSVIILLILQGYMLARNLQYRKVKGGKLVKENIYSNIDASAIII